MSDRRKIVVGMDSSPESQAAVDWARGVARPDDQIVVVHAWSNPVPLTPAYMAVAAPLPLEDYEQIAKQELARLVDGIPDGRIHPFLVEGRPGPAIVAEGADADLVVVGHRGDSQMSMMLGSTANYVLHHAIGPVVIVHGASPTAPRRVVVGVDDHHLDDDTNESVQALRWAYGLDGVEEIRVVHAWTLYPLAWDITGVIVTHMADFEAGAHAVVGRVVDAAGPAPAGVRLVQQTVQGPPARVLMEAAPDTDLIVVGTRGRGGFAGLVLGSTSTEVAAHSHVPVVIVR